MSNRYWFSDPGDELRDVLIDIARSGSHVSSEFVDALLEDETAADDKSERDDTFDPTEDDQL
jgi:hypothetical protein